MKVLLIGSGGREHALAWKIAQSPFLRQLICAPGNPGTASLDKTENIDIKANDIDGLVSYAAGNDIDLVVVGPEEPLVLGITDRMKEAGIKVFGPSKAASQLEGSKAFMKDLLAKAGVPTAFYGRFTDIETATQFIKENGAPIVVKTDGLAAGKGVIICETEEDAIQAATDMLSGASFGDAGAEVVIEEFLEGEEISFFALCDGQTVLPLTSAQDHKRAFDNDEGPNTGGMGAYSPAHVMTDRIEEIIIRDHLELTLKTMAAEGYPFTGVLFAGLMLTKDGPKMLEYNIRFGDPECQALMLRMEGDLLDILDKAAETRLSEVLSDISWSKDSSICVVMATKGYPGSYQKGSVIQGLSQIKTAQVFHAGTAADDKGNLLAVGGRVLNVCAKADDLERARDIAYSALKQIDWPDGFYRKDIGWRAFCKEKKAS
jgi:phosphoribosylamine--glycine ligase